MKKILLSITYFLACILSVDAQTLYGTTSKGGNYGGGTIIKFLPATNNLTVGRSFESIGGRSGENFIQASDGKLYSVARLGGSNNTGIIFSFDPSASPAVAYTKLKDFDANNTNGVNPVGSLIQANDGKLYGMADGGSNGAGVIFSFDPSTSTYTKLKDFDGASGGTPFGSLIQASNGKLYGITFVGGSSNVGVIFSFDPSSSTYTKLKDFDAPTGSNPRGSLVQASDGKLYGTTQFGGSNNIGVIFSYDPSTSTYTKLKDFDGTDGSYPSGSLLQANDGKLYGTSATGGSSSVGVIFSFDPSSFTYTKLKDFDVTDGSYPTGSLVQAGNGKLYGMTSGGGGIGVDVIFSFDPLDSTYTKLKDFDGTDGSYPTGSLLQASNEKLYGMAGGGSTDAGVIFSFDPSSSAYAKLKDFGTNETGTSVLAGLVHASDGKLYGVTSFGGSKGVGVIFSFDPSSSTYTKLKDFDGINGGSPFSNLIQASDGKFYGTANGGSYGFGVIFSFDPLSSTYTKLKDFDGSDGANPTGSLIQASDGKLYGVAGGARNYDLGTIYSFDPSTSIYTKLYNFSSQQGIFPVGSLVQATDGKLYGMTGATVWDGFSADGSGVIFSYDLSASTYTKLKDFDSTDGARPNGSLMQASDGKLYGMTAFGGSSHVGVLFSMDPASSTYTRLHDFDNTNGANPLGNLMQASDGKLYGTTNNGGSNNLGVIFSFDPSTSDYSKLQDHTGSNGANPSAAFVEIKQGGGVYCSANGICSDKGFIKNVYACYSFNNTTGCTGYGDYTAKVVNTAPNKILGFSVTPGYNSNTYQPLVYVRVWIDWNADGDFTDAGELVFGPGHPVNIKTKFWIRVPVGVSAGSKRMRVAVGPGRTISPCGPIANGEVEDYTININATRFAVPDAGPDAFDEAGNSFTIYPNPVQNKMIIERSGYDEIKASNTPALMVLTDARGRTLMRLRLASLVQAVDVSKLTSGVYFVTIINGNNKSTNKIIVNR